MAQKEAGSLTLHSVPGILPALSWARHKPPSSSPEEPSAAFIPNFRLTWVSLIQPRPRGTGTPRVTVQSRGKGGCEAQRKGRPSLVEYLFNPWD